MENPPQTLSRKIGQCEICRDRFAATPTGHEPRPIVWFQPGARILIAGQAPGNRVHQSGKPFTDPSGDRLRDWMGIGEDAFYDRGRIAILPMAFCYPGLSAKGADLPPPPICARTWRLDVMQSLGPMRLTLLVGGYAQKWHLGKAAGTVTQTVANWRNLPEGVFALPHPSWRNTGWIKRNPWFSSQLLPALRNHVKDALNDD